MRTLPPPTGSITTHLALMRHGRTAWNALGRFQGLTDIPLDDAGRAQARALAVQLDGRVDAVFTSDLRRASETADIIASALNIPVLARESDLRERGYGVFEGLTRAECIARYPEAWAARERDRNFEPPGGEPRKEVLARMNLALLRVVDAMRACQNARGQARALIVGHGSSLRMFLEQLTVEPVTSLGNSEVREVRHDGDAFQLTFGAAR